MIALELWLRMDRIAPVPKTQILFAADPAYRDEPWFLFTPESHIRTGYCLFDPLTPFTDVTITLKQSRLVRIPLVPSFVTPRHSLEFGVEILFTDSADGNFDYRQSGSYRSTRSLKATEDPAAQAAETVLEEWLPEGRYQVNVRLDEADSGAYLGSASREIIVPAGEAPISLPPLVIQPKKKHALAGKPAPEIDAIDLGSGRPVKLADFRGKVVLLDFWGYWCGVCNNNMPALVELQRKLAGQPFVIVALHDQSVQSRAAYDAKISTVRQRLWGGKDLPFTVLLDRPDPDRPEDFGPEGTGMSTRRYGVVGFPTLFLIDAEGVVKGTVGSQHDRLESLVRELLEKVKSS